MKKLSILLFVLLANYSAFCQTNYVPGNIKKSNGETVSGLIDYREWSVNPTKISFKSDLQGAVTEYTVFDLVSFEITGRERYVSARINKDIRPVKAQDLALSSKPKNEDDVAFLRELFSNKNIELYVFRDFKDHFYVRQAGGDFEELQYALKLTENGAAEELSIFRNQLMAYFPEVKTNTKLSSKLEKLRYTESDLSGFFFQVTKTEPGKKNRKKPQFFIGTGALFSKLDVTGGTKLADHQFDMTVKPLFFAGVDFFSSRNRGRFVVRAQFEFNQLEYTSTFNRPVPPANIEKETYTLNMNNFKPSLSLLYNFWTKPGFRVFAGLGVTTNISRYQKNLFTRKDDATGYFSSENDILVYQNAWFTIDGMAGMVLANKFELSLSSRVFGSFSNTNGVNVKPTLIGLRAAYRF